ncbi:nuclear transport factor 2 family protein [Confluentibacter flavum]|uniref:Nuclear transport factor 2 family protein n=1 Tax=Confluentibacter flavum TaxID=1909700 RepID=A0A2N3HI99_9FLAO|nr:nuclear transport factor 2 family protein [Confluentibacter flavum]PKQ44612.1 hypothetical protein CSW08_12310 [Confluentibacter flavum]
MKKLLLLVTVAALFAACQNKPERYTTTSTNIDVIKKLVSDYEAGNWDAWTSNYSDSAKIYQNTWKKSATPKETSASLQGLLDNTSSYGFKHGEDEIFFEQTIDDKGETWVNFWGVWHGTLAANGQELEVPVHLTCHMIDGKIAEEYGFYNLSEVMAALEVIEATKMDIEMSAMEE